MLGRMAANAEEVELWRALFVSMTHLLNTVEADVKRSSDLTLLDLGILLALGRSGESRPMGQLAGLFGVDPSVVTYRMKRLEGMGYASRTVSPADRRVTAASSTEAGRAALRSARTSMLDSAERNFLSLVDPDQLPVLTAVFRQLQASQRHPDGTTAPLPAHDHGRAGQGPEG